MYVLEFSTIVWFVVQCTALGFQNIFVQSIKYFSNIWISPCTFTRTRDEEYKVNHFRCLYTVPSPPEDLLAEVVSPGTVQLKWEPPREQNGIITYYIIYYNSVKDVPDHDWLSLTKNGGYLKSSTCTLRKLNTWYSFCTSYSCVLQ